jgi:hypothetical protein
MPEVDSCRAHVSSRQLKQLDDAVLPAVRATFSPNVSSSMVFSTSSRVILIVVLRPVNGEDFCW